MSSISKHLINSSEKKKEFDVLKISKGLNSLAVKNMY